MTWKECLIILKLVEEVFDIIQGHQITEEEIYNSNGSIPIFTANNKGIGFVNEAIVSEERLPCISYPTKGQVGSFFIQDSLFNANNTGLLIPKDEWRDKIDLYWVISYLSPLIKRMYNSQGGVGYIGKNLMSKIPLNIPVLDRQQEIGALHYKKELAVKKIEKVHFKIETIIRNIKIQGDYQKNNVKLKKVFSISGGNNGLTREFIYKNQPSDNEKALKVYSGATTKDGELGYISRDARIKVEEGPAIVVVRKGKAGWMELIEDKYFAINDDAYVLKVKGEWEVNLNWFINQYQELFFNIVTSKSDNGTFSKGYAEEQYIALPDINIQNKVAKELKKYNELMLNLEKLNCKIRSLLEKQIL